MGSFGRWCHWVIYRPRHYWWIFIVISALLVGAFWLSPSEQNVRIAGVILQLVGFILVACGIDSTLGSFGQTRIVGTLRTWARIWWQERPWRASRPGPLSGNTAMKFSSQANATAEAGSEASIEQRVELLEQKIRASAERVSSLRDDLDTLRYSLEGRIDEAIDVSHREVSAVVEKLRVKFVDELGSELMGVVFFVMGTILSSVPQEIASQLNQ